MTRGIHFINDIDKMRDFFILTKQEFLDSYSYLNEEDYDATSERVSDKQRYNNNLMFNTKYLIRDVFYLEQLKELQADINQAIMDKEELND